jgi:aspartyl-tRNA(Asn)/glutamyl-tRNA(Gln) amidotransferase subunit B
MMKYDVVIGIETHIQLNTASKMFCSCSTAAWEAAPNTQVCPVCLGLPGALPVINKAALEKAMLVGLALGSTISPRSKFDRKNYFYPDLAKGYQISQYDQPLNVGGEVACDGFTVGLIRAHLEEDVGKLNHDGDRSLVDFNKGGIPLLEIVSEPVIHSSSQAKEYVQTLRQLVRYIGVNDGNLERGVMRADVNISLQVPGKWRYQDGEFTVEAGYTLNNRAEIKNLNSFRSIERAIEYEIKRQSKLLDAGQSVVQETRGWDEAKGATTSQRSKEEAHDYRYFPEPDLPPLEVDRSWVENIRQQLPELPMSKRQRFMQDYGLSDYDARLLADERQVAEWFEQVVQAHSGLQEADGAVKDRAKKVANWMLGEIARLQNEQQKYVYESQLQPQQLSAILRLIDEGKLSGANAKELVAELYVNGGEPEQLIKERGLEQVSGSDDLEPIALKVIEANPEAVEKIKAGKTATIQFLVGQVMKETRGRANPGTVKELLEKLIG